jgi:hypothetical protein
VAVNNLPQGATLILKCKRSGQSDFTAIDPAKKLYILKGTQIEFQPAVGNAVQPINFSTAAWSGTAGAAGSSASKTVLFNAASASNNDAGAKTVTVTFGGQSVTVRCLIYELTAAVTPLDNFNGRSLTDFGVDERVDLDCAIAPAGIAAGDVGGLRWSVTTPATAGRDKAGLMQRTKTNRQPPEANGKAHYIAPYLTDNLHNPPTTATKTVTLKLAVQDGPCKGEGLTLNVTVHMPKAHMKKRVNSDKHRNGRASAGFLGEIFLFPKNVSFTGSSMNNVPVMRLGVGPAGLSPG